MEEARSVFQNLTVLKKKLFQSLEPWKSDLTAVVGVFTKHQSNLLFTFSFSVQPSIP
jgi:hypothetical protein